MTVQMYSHYNDLPCIKPHIDGPMLLCSDGSFVWLSMLDRMLLFFEITDVSKLDRKYTKR